MAHGPSWMLLCLEEDRDEEWDSGCLGKHVPRLGCWRGGGGGQERDRGERDRGSRRGSETLGAGLIWGAHFDSSLV